MKLLPSESLEIFNTENVDVIFLLDYGKSQETGHVFGYTAFNHYFKKISNEDYLSTNHKSFYDSDIPVVQIERPGEEDGSIISWNVDVNRKIKQKKKGLFSRSDDNDEESFDFVGLFNNLIDPHQQMFSVCFNACIAVLISQIDITACFFQNFRNSAPVSDELVVPKTHSVNQ